MQLYAFDEKKGLLNLSRAISIEYYGRAERQIGLHDSTILLASFSDGSRFVLYGLSLTDLNYAITQGKDKTFFIKWEKLGPAADAVLSFS